MPSFQQPLAIYASVPPNPSDPSGPLWLGTQPVVTAEYPFWPNLDWSGDNINPSSGFGEIPQYLWSEPAVSNPQSDSIITFTRQFSIDTAFTPRTLPPTPTETMTTPESDYALVISHAADNQYTMQVNIITSSGLSPQFPTIINLDVPQPLQWRNVKMFRYVVGPLISGDSIQIQTIVRNIGRAESMPENNPAMFTWAMAVFHVVS